MCHKETIRNFALVAFIAGLFVAEGFCQTSIQNQINQAVSGGASEVVITPGSYTASSALTLNNVINFTVRAEGVTMVRTTRGTAMTITNCRNLEIRGLTIDYNPLVFTQGTIIAAASDWSYVDVQIHQGYPVEKPSGTRIEVFDKTTRLLKRNIYMIYGTTVDQLSTGVFRFHNTQAYYGNAVIGDFLVDHYPSQDGYHGIIVSRCTGVTLRNITQYASPGFGIMEDLSSGNSYIGIRITLGPTPSGATQPRLRTLHADGMHFSSDRQGPFIDSCLIENNGDDGVAIETMFDSITQAASGSTTIATTGMQTVQRGDTVVALTSDHRVNFEATVTNISGGTLTLNRPVSAQAGTLIYNASAQGNGYVITNSTFRNKRARGFMIKAGGLIQNNTFDWIQEPSIALYPEWDMWNQAGLSRNVRIIGNTIRRGIGMGVQGTISVSAWDAPAGDQKNIEISGNVLDSCTGINLNVTSAQGVRVLNNLFIYPQLSGTNPVVRINTSDSVTLRGNCVRGTGSETLLRTTNVTNLVGGSDGISANCGTAVRGSVQSLQADPAMTMRSFTFSLSPGAWRINLYNVKGRLVRQLLNRQWPGGRFSCTWNIPDGVYLLELANARHGPVHSRICTVTR